MEITKALKQKDLEIQQLRIEKATLEKKLKEVEQSLHNFSRKTIGAVSTQGWTIEKCVEDIYNHLENIIAVLPGHIYWLNRDNVYLGCNDEQAKSAGLTHRREIIGKTNYDFPWKDVAKEVDKVNQEVMQTGLKHVVEDHGIISTGEEKVYLTNKIPLRSREGDIIGVLGVSLDITDRKKTEQLQKEKEIMEQVSKAVEMLAGCIAHELRTPLCSINLNIDNLQKANKENKNECISNIKTAIKRSTSIIDMLLLKLRSLVTKKVHVDKFEQHSIKGCINAVLKEYPFYECEREKIVWDNNSNEDFIYLGDELFTKHTLFNLRRFTSEVQFSVVVETQEKLL